MKQMQAVPPIPEDGANGAAAPERAARPDIDIPALDPPARGGILPVLRAGFRTHRRAAIASALAVLAATTAAWVAVPRSYVAHGNLWLDHGFDQVAPRAAGAPAAAVTRNTEIRVVTSNAVLATVVDRLGLANVRGIGQPREGALLPRDAARRTAIDALRRDLRIDATGASYAVSVSYTARDRVLASAILNQLLDSYVEDRRSGGERGREQERMRGQIAAAREDTLRARSAVTGYRTATELTRGSGDPDLIARQVAVLDETLVDADAVSRVAERRAAGIRQETGPAGTTVTTERLIDLRAQARRLAEPEADQAIAPAQLAAINRVIAAETARANALATRAAETRDRAMLLRGVRDRMAGTLREAQETRGQLDQLARAAMQAEERFRLLSRQLADRLAREHAAPGTAYVIARADPATTRQQPAPLLLALGGLLASLLAAALAVAVLEALTKGFRSRQHLERKLGLSVLGQVPDVTKLPDADLAEDDPMGPPDYLYNHPRSPLGLAFRSIHAGLRLGTGATAPRSIAICSALQTEGKTTVAICLARSAAMAGLRVVLVDGDARRPAASRALAAHVEGGLAEVLAGDRPVRQALQRDTPSGAWFLAQAADNPTPPSAIASDAMADLIATLSQDFDLVIVDTPPTLALVEARAVAAMADGVLLVARSRSTPVGATRIAQEMLERAGARIRGATLTFVEPRAL